MEARNQRVRDFLPAALTFAHRAFAAAAILARAFALIFRRPRFAGLIACFPLRLALAPAPCCAALPPSLKALPKHSGEATTTKGA